jgi:uncharacterized protein (TIGR02646 family)
MIKVQKGAEPQVLHDNKTMWTNSLMALVNKYGSYANIPKKEKEVAIRNYFHPDISSALIGTQAKAKCIYCESYTNITGYANIEHYHPKSLYPKETFDWNNLFIGCTVCNTPKNNFDTVKEPFIHPVNDNPEDYLTFDELQYVPKHKDGDAYLKAYNVIKNCDLKRQSLVRKHADILLSFLKTYHALLEIIDHYNGLKLESKKLEDAFKILESLSILNDEAGDNAEYAAYMRYLLRKYQKIKEAVTIINVHSDELGLPCGFKWSFNY